jgi:hypothetical protein
MNTISQQTSGRPAKFGRTSVFSAIVLAAVLATGCTSLGSGLGMSTPSAGKVSLKGTSEIPPVMTEAKANGTIVVTNDHSISGSVTTTGIVGTAAHIHQAALGENGPVIVPLVRSSADTFVVPAGTRLTDAQYTAYAAGDLYVNVHSAAHPNGEIRGQLSQH